MRRAIVGLLACGACANGAAAAPAPTPVAATATAPASAPAPAPSPPASDPPAPPPPPRRGAYANLDPDDDFELGPPAAVADCKEQLKSAGITFTPAKIPVHTEGKAKLTCGAPQVVMYLRGPAKIAYDVPPVLTCTMALALARWEAIVAEESVRLLHSRVVKIEQLGTYNCRVIPRAPTLMSEHGYANAIDIGRLFLENGKAVSIYRDFERGDETKTATGAFLRIISRRANDEDVFSHVLTPFFDAAHDNHFHLDLARFRRDGTRPQE